MQIKAVAVALAASSLAAAPLAAQSVLDRSSAVISEDSELGGRSITPAFIIAAIAGIGIAVLLITDDDDDVAVSP